MVIETFVYNGEKDILDIRFNILYPYVDKFIICEFEETFSGKRKQKLLLKKWNEERNKFIDKVNYAFIPKKKYNKYRELAISSFQSFNNSFDFLFPLKVSSNSQIIN